MKYSFLTNLKKFSFFKVSYMAQLHNIHLRTGCFCNPGACQRHLNLTDDDLKAHFKVNL